MAVSSLAGRPGRAGSAGDAARLLPAVRSRRLAATGLAGGQWRDRVAAAQARGRGEESRGTWRDREDRFHRAGLGRKSVAGP
jgi:hypothetical protein